MLDNNTNEFFYEELIVPELVKSDALIGTGQLPKFDDDLLKQPLMIFILYQLLKFH